MIEDLKQEPTEDLMEYIAEYRDDPEHSNVAKIA